jgi:hypothetical protein
MSEIIAKPVVKNKFWIVENNGQKVATIQAIEEGGFVYVHNNERENFPSIKLLSKKYNIEFVKIEKVPKIELHDVHGYPCSTKPHDKIYDVQRKLPLYTKSSKSKSFFCAGYYTVKFSNTWVKAYCPKLITLNRYEYRGPYKTQEEQTSNLRKLNGQY